MRIGIEPPIITDYPSLRRAMALHRQKLGISQIAFDDLSGLQTGYTGKLECGLKHYGEMSLAVTLAGLGLALVPVLHGNPVKL